VEIKEWGDLGLRYPECKEKEVGIIQVMAQLIQPEVWDIPLAECVIEVEKTDSEEKIMLKAAHKLLESFDIKINKMK